MTTSTFEVIIFFWLKPTLTSAEKSTVNIFKYAVTRLLLTKFVYIDSEKSYTMCTNQVILSKITTEPPKTKQKLEI